MLKNFSKLALYDCDAYWMSKNGGYSPDYRTSLGKEIKEITLNMNQHRMILAGMDMDIHTALTPLRFKDIKKFRNLNNLAN